MTKDKIPLNQILDRCNGNRRMLEQLLIRYPGMQIDENLAEEIIGGNLDKGEIHRRLTKGLGVGKNHCSGKYLRSEWKVRHS